MYFCDSECNDSVSSSSYATELATKAGNFLGVIDATGILAPNEVFIQYKRDDFPPEPTKLLWATLITLVNEKCIAQAQLDRKIDPPSL